MNKIETIIAALQFASDNSDKTNFEYHIVEKALAAARSLRELKWRKAFICGRCEGVYADEVPSDCHCEVGVEPIFKRGFICYALDGEPK